MLAIIVIKINKNNYLCFQRGRLHGQARIMSEGGQAAQAHPEEIVLQEVQRSTYGVDWVRGEATVGRGGQPVL